MNLSTCLQEQLRMHPAMQAQDVLKLCYQAVHGAEHLLTDLDRAHAYFDREFATVPADPALPLTEDISDGICRINLGAWKAAGLPAEWLFRMFVHTAKAPTGDAAPMEAVLTEAAALCGHLPDWAETLSAWRDAGMPAIHHSEPYRAAEHPAYRIVRREYCALLPVLTQLAADPAVQAVAADAAIVRLLRDVLDDTYTITANAAGQCSVGRR